MKFVNSMLVAAYLLIVGLTAWSLVQNFGIKEVSVEAEVKRDPFSRISRQIGDEYYAALQIFLQ